MTEEFFEKCKKAKNFKELQKMVEKEGLDLPEDEFIAWYYSLSKFERIMIEKEGFSLH